MNNVATNTLNMKQNNQSEIPYFHQIKNENEEIGTTKTVFTFSNI